MSAQPVKLQIAEGGEGFLEFVIASQGYAIPISTVREINPIAEITPVPSAATHVCGVMNLRGKVLPVIDLKVRLQGQVTFKTRSTCIVVIQTSDGEVGLLVDSVCRVIALTAQSVTTAPSACHLPESSLVSGVAQDGERAITLLSMDDCIRAVDCTQIRTLAELKQNAYSTTASNKPSGEPVVAETKASTFALRSAALRLMD